MRATWVVVLCCMACDKGRRVPSGAGSSHEANRAPAVIPVDASQRAADAPSAPIPCTASTFGMTDPETPAKFAIGLSCELRGIRNEFTPTRLDQDVLTAKLDKSQWHAENGVLMIELRSAADISKIYKCDSIPRIDWKHEHVWVLVFDNSPSAEHEIKFVVRGADRSVIAMSNDHECVGDEPAPMWQQRELMFPVGVKPEVQLCPDQGPDCGPDDRP